MSIPLVIALTVFFMLAAQATFLYFFGLRILPRILPFLISRFALGIAGTRIQREVDRENRWTAEDDVARQKPDYLL